MPLVKCWECGHEVSRSAKTCPSCGAKEPSKTAWTRESGRMRLLVVLIIALVVIGILVDSGDSPPPAIPDALLVGTTITVLDASSFTFQEGPLEGGTAVLVEGTAAYWVYDGFVFAVNGTAKTWSPSIEYAPTGIDFFTVQSSVR